MLALRAEIVRLREQIASLQASSGYEAFAAAMTTDINPEIDISTPELKCEARLMQAYLLHVSTGGRPETFLAKALDMAQHIERTLAECKDDRPRKTHRH
jgi:predicted transcriptional regulator